MNIKKTLLCLFVLSSVFCIDLWTKGLWFGSHPPSFSFFHGLVTNVMHQNRGAIANIPVPQVLIIAVTILFILVLLIWLITRSRVSYLLSASFGLLLGGAMGNLLDRLRFGYVRDWMLVFHTSILNVADVTITLGILLIILDHEVQGKKPPA